MARSPGAARRSFSTLVRTALSALETRDRIRKLLEYNSSAIECIEWPSPNSKTSTEIFNFCTSRSLLSDFQQQQNKKSFMFPNFMPGRAGITGVVAAEPVKVGTSVLTVIEDCHRDGDHCIVQIHACIHKNAKQEEAEMWIPGKGALVLIREPMCTFISDSNQEELHPLVMVPSRAEFLLIGFRTSNEDYQTDHRILADKLFDRGKYATAALYYSSAMTMVEKTSREYVETMCKLSETHFRMSLLEDSVRVADIALRADPGHAKSLVIKARALHRLGLYERRLESLKTAFRVASDKTDVERALANCNMLVEQQKTGSYDISDFLMGGMKSEDAPECADYIGPVEIRVGEHGRGLYVTRHVEKGELLLVSNPIGAVYAQKGHDVETDLKVEVVRACMGSSRACAQLDTLPYTNELLKVPDMDVFKAGEGSEREEDEEEDFDVRGRLRMINKVLRHAGFGRTDESGNKTWAGLWGLPAFINHSCMPNVSRTDVGKAMFIRAAKELQSGEEIRFSYIDSAVSWSEFYCNCRRCKLEQEYEEVLQQVNVEVSANETVSKVEKVLETLEVSSEDKDLLRAGFLGAYVECDFEKFKCLEGFPSPLKVLRLLHEVAPAVDGTLMMMVRVRDRNLDVLDCEEADELLRDEVTALYGRQSEEVVESLLKRMQDDGKECEDIVVSLAKDER